LSHTRATAAPRHSGRVLRPRRWGRANEDRRRGRAPCASLVYPPASLAGQSFTLSSPSCSLVLINNHYFYSFLPFTALIHPFPAPFFLSTQACGLTGANQGQIVLAAGGAALVTDLDVRPPTLANLIGSLRVASQAQRDGDVPAAALAAASALQEDDLAALAAPSGGAAGPLRFGLTAGAAPSSELLSAAEVHWEVAGGAALREAEAAAWSQLLTTAAAAGSGKKGPTEAAFLAIVQPLLQKAQKARSALSYDLLCKLLMAAAGEYALLSGGWGGTFIFKTRAVSSSAGMNYQFYVDRDN
jgi:hypothetical protein